ncbi:hypothetical protein [Cryobacterium frigoriphilum]|nr:hypothetical protein [Cryobacterium frigoriphilum]
MTSLIELGESTSRVADLAALAPKDVKRMRSIAAPTPPKPANF